VEGDFHGSSFYEKAYILQARTFFRPVQKTCAAIAETNHPASLVRMFKPC
jgi:hypothetical protein